MEKKIRGFDVAYNFDALGGISYLSHSLPYIPAHKLFIEAKEKGQIEFKDNLGRDYLLVAKFGSGFVVKKTKLE